VELLVGQNGSRDADLVPVRHGRMMVSPFTFYRGAAAVMAADLASTSVSGLTVQLCGDAHLSNFGGFGSPERQLIFGLNDFDETLPGPFEYDVKRLATSFTIAAANNGFDPDVTETVTLEATRAYRQAMSDFAGMSTLDVWYSHLTEHDVRAAVRAAKTPGKKTGKKTGRKAGTSGTGDGTAGAEVSAMIKLNDKLLRKARTRDSLQAMSRYVEVVDGCQRIVSRPPAVVPLRDVASIVDMAPDAARDLVEDQFRAYGQTLSSERRRLLKRFRIVDVARKVVGVGSVGTRAFMVLLEGRDNQDPLFLQVKEATTSVLERHLPASAAETPGQRVVEGQRLMQPASDIFLGWTSVAENGRYYYWRQLRDMKVSAPVENMSPLRLTLYARLCGWTLAHAHARSGDPVAIAAYVGDDGGFERAISWFAKAYADQNAHDYTAFVDAVTTGRIPALRGV
jgi:uncharacterized protein (DUF2252 family)